MRLSYHLEIRGAIPGGAREELRRRFGDMVMRSDGDRTAISGLNVDQAALRAVLGLLWDVGGELHLVRARPRHPVTQRKAKGAER